MSALFGYLSRRDTAPSRETALAIARAGGLPASAVELGGDDARPAAMLGAHSVHRDEHLLAALVGRPVWKAAGLATSAARSSHAAALGQAYRENGLKWPQVLGGHFAAAIIDLRSHEAHLAIDRLGVQSLCYGIAGDGDLVFGTRASPLLCYPGIDGRLSAQGLYHYVYFHMVPSPGTIYQGLRKLAPATHLSFASGAHRVESYWLPRFTEHSRATVEQLSGELHQVLSESVAGEAAGADSVGAYLSGGLDSSTVAGKLSEERGEDAATFSIGFDAEGYDETPYARATAGHFNIRRQHEYFVTPEDVLEGVRRVAAAYDEPFGNSSALPAYYCARLARDHGIEVLLAGDGGDEIFAGNERYVTQEVFERYGRVPRPLRGLMERTFALLPLLQEAPFFRKAYSYVTQARIPLPDRLQRYNFLHRLVLAEVFTPDFMSQVSTDLPLHWQRARYQEPADASRVNRMLYFDWKFTLADNDLRKVSETAALAGVEVRYPMISEAMVDLSCRVPTDIKLKDDKLRWFYRQAMQGYLPEEVLRKSKHGFGLPFGVWMRDYPPLRDLATTSLNRQKSRGIFLPEFLDRLLEQHESVHAAYYGELVWVIMMLDLWLASHDGTSGDG